jgi:aldehyde:ferredoxin oxidoreductase
MDKEKWFNAKDELFLKVRDIVNKYDLEMLLIYTPEYEYDSEVIEILDKCRYVDASDMDNEIKYMIDELKEIFHYWFGSNFTDENLKEMAKELIELFSN